MVRTKFNLIIHRRLTEAQTRLCPNSSLQNNSVFSTFPDYRWPSVFRLRSRSRMFFFSVKSKRVFTLRLDLKRSVIFELLTHISHTLLSIISTFQHLNEKILSCYSTCAERGDSGLCGSFYFIWTFQLQRGQSHVSADYSPSFRVSLQLQNWNLWFCTFFDNDETFSWCELHKLFYKRVNAPTLSGGRSIYHWRSLVWGKSLLKPHRYREKTQSFHT